MTDQQTTAGPSAKAKASGAASAKPKRGFDLNGWTMPEPVVWSEILSAKPHRELLIGEWCPKGRAVAIYARSKEGKTEFVSEQVYGGLSAGLTITHLDMEQNEEDLRELLVALGATEIELANWHYYLHPSLPDLDRPGGSDAVLAVAQRDGSDLIVFDTASRFVAGEEDSNDTWRAFYRYTGAPIKAAGITWVRIDHAGKDKSRGQRGASAKNDDVDVVWELSRTDAGTRLVRKFSRVSWLPPQIDYVRETEPSLHYVNGSISLPVGTMEVAALLDRLGLPISVTNKIARKAISDANHTATSDVLAAAIRHRKYCADTLVSGEFLTTEAFRSATERPNLGSDETPRNAHGTDDETPASGFGTGDGTERNAETSSHGTFRPPRGGTLRNHPAESGLDTTADPKPVLRVSKRPARPPTPDDDDEVDVASRKRSVPRSKR